MRNKRFIAVILDRTEQFCIYFNFRNATIGFINNFGQIPSQLFKKPHPQKKVAYTDIYSSTPGVTTQRLFYHAFDSLKVPVQPIKGDF